MHGFSPDLELSARGGFFDTTHFKCRLRQTQCSTQCHWRVHTKSDSIY